MIDWLRASIAERQALYRTVKRLLDEEGLSWKDLYREALGRTHSPGLGYEDNFRAGRISRKAAHRLIVWMQIQHPSHATRLDAALGDRATAVGAPDEWDRFLVGRAAQDRLYIVTLDDPRIGVVGFVARDWVTQPHVRLRQHFCFQLDSPRAGKSLALQQVDRVWFPLPLTPDGLCAQVTKGVQLVPRAPDTGTPIGLSEDTHVGLHRFVMLIDATGDDLEAGLALGDAVQAAALDRIARVIVADPERYTVLRCDAMFTL